MDNYLSIYLTIYHRIDASCPMMIKGYSTGCPPIHVSDSRSATKIQNRHWLNGRNIMLRCLDVWRRGIRIKTRIDEIRARTPPNLLGIDRRIAYANKKYHSGLM